MISWGAKHNNLNVIRMGIDLHKIKYRCKSKSADIFKLIQVGRLTEKKAILDSIQAVNIAKNKINIRFDIVGAGDVYCEAYNLIKELKAQDYIILHGAKKHNEVLNLLNEADAYILPSKVAKNGDMEGIPVALMEAMAAGLPVISTYHSGIPELIQDDITGFLAHEGDVNQLSEKIVACHSLNIKELTEMTRAARTYVEDHYDNDKEVKSLLSLLK